ncbi:MAG: hypothetical protein HOI95_26875 [Chromatiales bacterium]|jgi:hypothetical protein|nr:hypothetical protein [Chromatiales bacterium]
MIAHHPTPVSRRAGQRVRPVARLIVQLTTGIGYLAMFAMTMNEAELEPDPKHESPEGLTEETPLMCTRALLPSRGVVTSI